MLIFGAVPATRHSHESGNLRFLVENTDARFRGHDELECEYV